MEELHFKKWRNKYLHELSGKIAVVTGSNSGIGFEAAKGFLALGATVVLACRNEGRATAALSKLKAAFPQGNCSFLPLDLASDASIASFAEEAAKRYEKIDIFLHCAGVYYPNVNRTKEGLPATVGINFAGTAKLTKAILPLLNETSRMIFTSSLVDRFGKVKKEGLLAPDKEEGYDAYARSKALLSAFVFQKAAERGEKEPAFLTVHPGIAATDLLSPAKTTHKPLFSKLSHAFLYLFTHSPEKASLPALFAACNGKNGEYFAPRGLFGVSGYPHTVQVCRNVRHIVKKESLDSFL